MTKRRIVLDAAVVAAGIGFLLLPYLLPERRGSRQDFSCPSASCTRFVVSQNSTAAGGNPVAGAAPWTASIIISNAGTRGAEFLSGEIVSRFKTGSESWWVPVAGRVVPPRTATTITLPLPAQASGSATPRVWELQCSYRTRISKVDDWLGAVVARLPRGLQVIDVPCVGKDQSVARYPENYDRVLTNDLGWRHKFMGGFSGAAGREWRPAVEAPTPQQRSWAEKIVRELGGQRIAILALALTTPGGAGSNKSPAMVIIKKEFAVYRGQLDGITEESVRIRAPVANESGQFETVEVRIADIRQWAFGKYALEDPEAVFEWMMTPHPMLDPRIDARMVAQQLAQQTNRSSPTAGFRRSS